MNAKEVLTELSKRYEPPVYAFFAEVANGTGGVGRYIDAVAYSLYPSMDHEIHGFEIKVDRGDFLKEMGTPQKAAESMQFCNRWWLVAPKGIAHKDELPKTWGFYEIVNGKIYKRKQASELKPKISLSFIAALLRRSTENTIPRMTLWNRIDEARVEARKGFQKEIEKAEEDLKKYREDVAVFEKASGITVLDKWGYDPKEVGEAVQFVLQGGFKSASWNIDSALRDMEHITDVLKKFKALANSTKL